MIDMILQHYLVKSTYTNVKDFEEYFRILLDDFEALGKTICSQIIHPRVLMYPNKSLKTLRSVGRIPGGTSEMRG